MFAPPVVFNAGLRKGTYPDPLTGAPTPIFFWYPTKTAEPDAGPGPFQVPLAADAPLAAGVFPAVVISHGSGGSHFAHRDTATTLARSGFVVAVPLHARNSFLDSSDVGTVQSYRERPRQVSAAIDAVLAQPSLAGRVDAQRIGAMGFSGGAYGVLVAAGGIAELSLMGQHCQAHPDDAFCIGGRQAGYSFADDDPDGLVVSLEPDRRIRAAVLMAPLGVVFGDGSLDRVDIPVRLYRAEHDESLTSPFHAERVRDLLPRPPEYAVAAGGGHFAFISPFPPGIGGEAAHDPPGFDRAAYQAQLNAEVCEFFSRTLG
jgi:predicted dienelactone hydrolase